MTGSASVDALLLAALLAAAAISAARLVAGRDAGHVDRYLSGRDADGAHLVMNLAMASMLTPWWGSAAWTVSMVAFGLVALVVAALLVAGLAGRPGTLRSHRPSHVYHLLAATAMIFATALVRPAAAPADGMHHAHDAMTHTGAGPASVVAWALVVVFALDLVATAVLVFAAPRRAIAAVAHEGAAGPGRVTTTTVDSTDSAVRTLRWAAAPHLVMDLAMVAMLLAVV